MSSLESPAPNLQTAGDATFLAAAPAPNKWRTGPSFLGPEGARAIQNGHGEAAETDEPPPRCPPLSAPDPANYPDDLAEKANVNGLSVFVHSGYSHVLFCLTSTFFRRMGHNIFAIQSVPTHRDTSITALTALACLAQRTRSCNNNLSQERCGQAAAVRKLLAGRLEDDDVSGGQAPDCKLAAPPCHAVKIGDLHVLEREG